MVRPRAYLDYNASAPLLPEAGAAMAAVMAMTGNPSSVHAEGRRLRALIEAAREDVAALLHARPSQVVFTSGASEANATALGAGWDCVLVAGTEHESVLMPVRASRAAIVELPVAPSGDLEFGALTERVLKGPRLPARTVVALQMANNETGVLQPVAEVAAFARAHGLSLHTDAVQAVGRLPVDFEALGADTLSVSAHKFGGPKGVGALVVRDGVEFAPLICGGGQERRRRAGTENIAAIVGFGAAARVAARENAGLAARMAALRDRLERGVLQVTPDAVIIGYGADRLPNTSCFGVPGKAAEIMVIKLDVAGFSVSSGSACSSGKVGASHVLAAMGIDPAVARSAIRISIGHETTAAEIEAFLEQWQDIHGAKAANPAPASWQIETGGRATRAAAATGE